MAERFRAAMETVSDAFYAVDREWRLVVFNGAAEAYFGFGADAVLGKSLWELFPQGKGTAFGDALERAMDAREASSLLTESALTRGKSIQVRIAPWDDGVCVAIDDITERDAAQRRLRESEERLRLATEGAGVGAYELDLTKGDGFWSASAFKLLGLEPTEDLRGNFAAWRSALHPEDLERVEREHNEAAAVGGSWRSEYRVVRRDTGETRWLSTFGQFIAKPHGGVRSIGVALDITERKLAELVGEARADAFEYELERAIASRAADLQESEARLRAIFDTSHMYQGLLSPDGAILYVNERALRDVDVGLNDVVGQTFWGAPWFAATAGAPETIRSAIEQARGGDVVTPALIIELPAGKRHFEFAIRPVRNEAGGTVHILAEAIDITARVEAEEALRQSQKLEAMGQLTGGVAHDFNNLLMIVSGGLNMLERKEDPARREMLVARMREAVERGAKLTQQLLAFSRKHDLAPETIDFGAQVRQMRELLDRSLGGQVRVALDIASDLKPIYVDPNGLQQALLNLAVNARDAMPDGGIITIRAFNGAPDDPRAARVSIAVADTGVGMSADTIARIFEPFFTTKDVGKGSGLGLAQVHGFAQQSGGRVEVRSTPAQGTTMTLVLPVSQAPLASAPAYAADRNTRPTTPAGHALLVEDDNDVAVFSEELLSELGWRITRAASGEEALRVLQAGRFDLVFSDVMMPGGMNGLELARHIREREPKLPILLTSGYAPVAAEVARAGLSLLAKPYTIEALARAISEVRTER